MHVNTKIVNALLSLRGIQIDHLAAVTGISPAALTSWLDGTATENDERLTFERQLEVIKVLGIVGEHPRSDVTHNWFLHEPTFGNRLAAWEPLRMILFCFGRCEITHIAREADPLVSLKATTYFGLTFDKFRAVLQVTSSALRSLAFEPSALPNLSWMGDEAPMVVKDEAFQILVTPGEATPGIIDRERVKALTPMRWNRLAQLADERGLGATDLAQFLIDKVPLQPALSHEPAAATAPSGGSEESVAAPLAQPANAAASAVENRVSAAPKKLGPGDPFFTPSSSKVSLAVQRSIAA